VLAVSGCASAVPSFADASTYLCLSHSIDAETLRAAPPIADLTGAAAEMVANAQSDDGTPLDLDASAGWVLAGTGDESLLIMRPLADGEADGYGPPGSDHEIIEISRLHGTNTDPNAWYVTSHSVCPLTIDLGALNVPSVALDPAQSPTAEATELALLVTESECNSGKAADHRVKLVALEETDTTVTVTIGVKARGGYQTCPGNPATPFTVKLDAPLGDRTIVDGTRGVPLTVP
jgi:hypothetical protein